MNVNSGGPHILLFERDQQLTTQLSGELAQAGYEVHMARTAVEVFDAIARFPVRLVMVDLAQAQASRREFWVALDAQRRGRGVQVFTFRCANIGGYGPEDPDERVETVHTDLEVEGAIGVALLVDAVRGRVPGSTPVVNAPARSIPESYQGQMTARPMDRPAVPQIPASPTISTSQPLQATMRPYPSQEIAASVSLSRPAETPRGGHSTFTDKIRAVIYPSNRNTSTTPETNWAPHNAPASGNNAAQYQNPEVRQQPGQRFGEREQSEIVSREEMLYQAQAAANLRQAQATPGQPSYQAGMNQQAPSQQTYQQSTGQQPYQAGMSQPIPIQQAYQPPTGQQSYQAGMSQPIPIQQTYQQAPSQPIYQQSTNQQVAGQQSYQAEVSQQAPNQQSYPAYTMAAPAPATGTRFAGEESGLDQLSRLLRDNQSASQNGLVNGNIAAPPAAGALSIDPQELQDLRAQILQAARLDEAYERSGATQPRQQPDTFNAGPPLRASPIQDTPFEGEVNSHRSMMSGPLSQAPENIARPAMTILQPTQIMPPLQQLSQSSPAQFYQASQAGYPASGENRAYQSGANPQVHPLSPIREAEMPSSTASHSHIRPVPETQELSSDKRLSGGLNLEEEMTLADQVQATIQQTLARRPEVKTSDDMLLDIVKSLPPMAPAPQPPQVLSGRATRTLGSVLLEGHLVPQERLQVAQHVQRMLRGVDLNYQLGEILLMFKLLTPDQLLAASLVSYGMISTVQISALGRIRQELHAIGLEYDLESLVVLFRILTPEQLREVRASWSS